MRSPDQSLRRCEPHRRRHAAHFRSIYAYLVQCQRSIRYLYGIRAFRHFGLAESRSIFDPDEVLVRHSAIQRDAPDSCHARIASPIAATPGRSNTRCWRWSPSGWVGLLWATKTSSITMRCAAIPDLPGVDPALVRVQLCSCTARGIWARHARGRAQCGALRVKLLKVAARVRITARKVCLSVVGHKSPPMRRPSPAIRRVTRPPPVVANQDSASGRSP